MSNYKVQVLPEIEMYGGDTTPWEITLVDNLDNPFSVEVGSDCTATLSFAPIKASSGISGSAVSFGSIFSKPGVISENSSGGTSITFDFEEQETKSLRGKFLYQIEIRHGDGVRIGQGSVYIKQNINQ